ncbi:MAG: zinc ribbon domain-containing protein [Methanobrevibacter sp.]|uniref:zinc ribbon domain-containing protein n=1 Tax=Methanobrevibacter sp. TaxID=66852 RepID=UPI0026DF8415|nr:zinc ribbon domain-containing protein [Methanobrevibacter sp.]MDO5848259.1 zinc ribbon domain-containing protein [Methanobrevibacter sp.]
MVLRRCPQCHGTTDDKYGFCLKCGYEYPDKKNIDYTNISGENTTKCISCGFENPEEADFCVNCGMPLIFNKQFENTGNKPIVIKYGSIGGSKPEEPTDYKKTSNLVIALGYIFSILGGIIGLIFAIYLSTRKDPRARKHGHIQLGIFIFYLIIIGINIATGSVTVDQIANMTTMQKLYPFNF